MRNATLSIGTSACVSRPLKRGCIAHASLTPSPSSLPLAYLNVGAQSEAHQNRRRRSAIVRSAALYPVSTPREGPEGGRVQLSDVIDGFINLPWKKIASWMAVAFLGTQLKDFLGVSPIKRLAVP